MMHKYAVIAVIASVLVVLPAIISYEKKRASSAELVSVAIMTALCSLGRMVFAGASGFKPVTALVIVTGAGLGGGAGFITGALSAVISNMYFGQGPWTPFQMAVWGLIGLAAGVFGRQIRGSRIFMLIFGAASGVLYSLLMDVFTVLSQGDGFGISAYAAAVGTSLPFMALYAASDVVFLWALGKPMCRKLARLKLKYF